MYHGPREQVVPFFESLGFKLPPRKGTADFLQEITSQKDQAVRSYILPSYLDNTHAVCDMVPSYLHKVSETCCQSCQHVKIRHGCRLRETVPDGTVGKI